MAEKRSKSENIKRNEQTLKKHLKKLLADGLKRYLKRLKGYFTEEKLGSVRKENREWLTALKNDLVCILCGQNDSCCLDFHHIDDKTKKFNISSMMSEDKLTIAFEIEKCVVLCSNCHRKYHHSRKQ